MSSNNEFELQSNASTVPETRTLHETDHERTEMATGTNVISALPPVDRGKAAGTMLLAGCIFEALLWGFPLSFGVFQNYYSNLPEFKDDPYVAVVGTTASGISYLAAPVVIPIIRRLARYRHLMIWIGWPFCLLGLVAGSFATSLPTLVLTQGVMYGVGFTIFYYPILSMLTEWWIARRGFAAGIMCSASGVSGIVMPYCIDALLQRYGYQTTLRAIAIGLFIITGPLIFFIKGRVAEEGTASGTDWSFLKAPRFWIYSASNFAMGLGYFFPSLYLSSYASANGMSSSLGAVLLALMSVSQVAGQISFGYLSDGKVSLDKLAMLSTTVAAIAVYGCWGVAHSFSVLAVFAIIFGFFGTGFTALWVRMGMAVSAEPTGAFAAFGLLNLGKGLGNVLAGPLGGALLREVIYVRSYGVGKYESVVLLTGSCMIVSTAIIALYHLRSIRSR